MIELSLGDLWQQSLTWVHELLGLHEDFLKGPPAWKV